MSKLKDEPPKLPITVDNVSKKADVVHDALIKRSAMFTAAKNAMSTVTSADVLKMTPRECLAPVKHVIDALELVKSIHPFIGVAVVALQAVLALEMKRRENDRRASGLLVKQAEMLSVLFQLEKIHPNDIQAGVHNLQILMTKITEEITECGNLLDTFFRQKFLGRFLRAGKWEEKLMKFVDKFNEWKGKIQEALQVYVAVKLTSVSTHVEAIDMKVDILIALFKNQTDREKKAAVEVKRRGGEEYCMKDEAALTQLEKDTTTSTDRQMEIGSTSLLLSFRSSIDALVDQNKANFDAKIEAQSKQLKDAIQNSTQTIIERFGSGPWGRVIDPECVERYGSLSSRYLVISILRHNLQNARSSVKARHLVLALHDYFIDLDKNVSPDPNTNNNPQPKQLGVEALSLAGTDLSEGDRSSMESLQKDKWCIPFLSLERVPAIAEAIDDDASGFIRVAEVNDFYRQKPKGFSMLRWITFWAAGWDVEVTIYHQRIEALIERLLDLVILPENGQFYVEYKDVLRWVPWLLRSHWQETTEDSELLDLVREHMAQQEAEMTMRLKPANWEIDSMETISTLLGPGRIEKYLYPLLYFVLRRHYQVFKLGCKTALKSMEFESASETIRSILAACTSRSLKLEASYEQQSVSLADRLKRHAGGLFARWQDANPWTDRWGSQITADDHHPFEFQAWSIDVEEDIPEINPEDLRYGVAPPLKEMVAHRQLIDLLKIYLMTDSEESEHAEDQKVGQLFESVTESEQHACMEMASLEIMREEFEKGLQ
ncbi:hypothetical protein BU17DRAFT_89697 [Hysterangium stoloniferum]|nr:hypothetical protein BU17DRAFT_89697 [Hysterangium stoloniferum]